MASIMKRPLNNLENPVYPDIRKAGPIFKSAKMNNILDTGRVLMELENHPELNVEYAVLVQSRDRNSQHQYGKSSHKSVVNKEFRPPLLDPYLDNQALSRVPTKIKPIKPGMINPGSENGFHASNTSVPEMDRYLTDGAKDNSWRINVKAPYDPDMQILEPDLEAKLTKGYDTAGFVYAPRVYNPDNAPTITDTMLNSKLTASVSAGTNTRYQSNNFMQVNSEQVPVLAEAKLVQDATSRFNAVYSHDTNLIDNPLSTLILDEKLNDVQSAGYSTMYRTSIGETKLVSMGDTSHAIREDLLADTSSGVTSFSNTTALYNPTTFDNVNLETRFVDEAGSVKHSGTVARPECIGSCEFIAKPNDTTKFYNTKYTPYAASSGKNVPIKIVKSTDGADASCRLSRRKKSALGKYNAASTTQGNATYATKYGLSASQQMSSVRLKK